MQAENPSSERVVCHLNLAKHYRGGERQTELLVRELATRGARQRLVVRHGHELLDRCADVEGLELTPVKPNPVAAGLAVRGAAIAHAHDARSVYSGLLAQMLFDVPFIMTRRVVAPQKSSNMRNLAYRKAAGIAAVSNAVADHLREKHPGAEVMVVPDAHAGFESDPDAVAAIRARFNGKTVIGHVGALVHSHKGQSTIIEVARQAANEHPDWQFVLCGNGEDEERFRREIGELDNIELTGWVDNVGDYLASFDVFVYPSLHEALGSTLLDALHAGLPIVASNVGGIPEFVRDGENGRLVQPENPSQLLAGIEEMLGSPAALNELHARNRDRAAQFDTAAMADAYERMYAFTEQLA